MPENYHWILARLNKNRQALNGTDIHEIEIDATGRYDATNSIKSELARANFSEIGQLSNFGKLVSCLYTGPDLKTESCLWSQLVERNY